MRHRPSVWIIFAFSVLVAASAVINGYSQAAQSVRTQPQEQAQKAENLAPYVPTPQPVVDKMLELAAVTSADVVYDLGCGDGRIVITAAKKYGARAVGVDIDPDRIREAEANAKAAGVENLVKFKLQDALTVDVSEASVVTLYLLTSSNLKLRPILTRQLKPGSRIVSHTFGMGDWQPLKTESVDDNDGYGRTIYLWKADGVARP